MATPLDKFFDERFPDNSPIYSSMVRQYDMDPAFEHRKRRHLTPDYRDVKRAMFAYIYGSRARPSQRDVQVYVDHQRQMQIGMMSLWRAIQQPIDPTPKI